MQTSHASGVRYPFPCLRLLFSLLSLGFHLLVLCLQAGTFGLAVNTSFLTAITLALLKQPREELSSKTPFVGLTTSLKTFYPFLKRSGTPLLFRLCAGRDPRKKTASRDLPLAVKLLPMEKVLIRNRCHSTCQGCQGSRNTLGSSDSGWLSLCLYY